MNFNDYKGNQWIFNSDRLVLNAKKDNIFLLAAKDLTMSTQGSVHIDTPGTFVVNATKIQLGLDNGKLEPIAKGKSTVDVLNSIIDALTKLASTLSGATGAGVGVISLMTVNTGGANLLDDIQQIKKNVDSIKSTLTYSN